MDPKLAQLIEKARTMVVTDEDKEAQRRSFAYGNVALDDPRITREDIDKAAERMSPRKEPSQGHSMKLCKDCSKDPTVCDDMGCSCSCHHAPSTVTTLPAPPVDDLVERVAEAIFLARYTCVAPLEDYERIVGTKPKVWKTNAPWDTNPDELAEHERDDYRWMAKAAIEAMKGT